jgi:beta-galactosidase
MMVTDPVHITHWGVAVSTPVVSEKNAMVLVKTKVKNETSSSQRVIVKTIIWNKRSKNAGHGQLKISNKKYEGCWRY